MLISRRNKVIMLRNCKTGSSSLGRLFKSVFTDHEESMGHEPKISNAFPKIDKKEYRVILSIRNPYDRLFSMWRSIIHTSDHYLNKHTFPEFVKWVKDNPKKSYLTGHHVMPQTNWYFGNNVTDIIKQENYEDDIRKIDFFDEYEIPFVNSFKDKLDVYYLDYYTLTEIKTVNDIYRKDFEVFNNYKMIE